MFILLCIQQWKIDFIKKAQLTVITAMDWQSEQEIEKDWVQVIKTTLYALGDPFSLWAREDGRRRCVRMRD